jgi:hypothetical protein
MTAENGNTDFLQNFSSEADEVQAYREMLDYLVNTGRYADAAQADQDASERVRFCEEMDLYATDARLKNASVVQRKLQALIHSNQLQDVIAENGGYLPGCNETGSAETGSAQPGLAQFMRDTEDDEVLPEIYPGTDVVDLVRADTDHAGSADDPFSAEPAIEKAAAGDENVLLHLIRYVSTSLGFVIVILAAFKFYFDSDDLLWLTKQCFLLFTVLLLVFVALSEVSSRLLTRMRYVVSYSFLMVTATLSGLLFLQQPWADTALHHRGGALGLIVNFIIHGAIAIGPFWLGVFFAVSAVLLFIATWFAGRKIADD